MNCSNIRTPALHRDAIHTEAATRAGDREPPKWVALLVLALLAVATLAGCGIGDVAAPAETAPFTPAPAPAPPAAVKLSVCIDWSPSVEKAAKLQARKDLADMVAQWPIPEATGASKGSASSPGLDLRIRKVLGNDVPAEGVAAEVVHVRLPSIPQLDPAPDPDDPHLLEQTKARNQRRKDVDRLLAESEKDRGDGSHAIRTADLTATASDIVGCLQGAARSQPSGTVVAISDFLQADANGSALQRSPIAELKGRNIVLVVACSGSGRCGASLDLWRKFLNDTHLQIIAPEELHDFLDGLARP